MRSTSHWKELIGFMALALSALFTPLEGQGGAASRAPVATRVEYVLVEGADYAFRNPPTDTSGVVAFDLVKVGQELHAMTLLKLPRNHTLREFLDMYHQKGIIPPRNAHAGPDRHDRARTEKEMVPLITVT